MTTTNAAINALIDDDVSANSHHTLTMDAASISTPLPPNDNTLDYMLQLANISAVIKRMRQTRLPVPPSLAAAHLLLPLPTLPVTIPSQMTLLDKSLIAEEVGTPDP